MPRSAEYSESLNENAASFLERDGVFGFGLILELLFFLAKGLH